VDGAYVPVDYVTTPMIERDELTGVVVSFNDITTRHRSEAALQKSHRMLEETLVQLKTTQQQMLQQERLRAMGQMASGIAHDFNNSLSPIVGFAELLKRHPDLPQETTKTYAELITTAALDAASVIKRLRELYRERDESECKDSSRLLGHCSSSCVGAELQVLRCTNCETPVLLRWSRVSRHRRDDRSISLRGRCPTR
jgi:signal transduction histidine kinase